MGIFYQAGYWATAIPSYLLHRLKVYHSGRIPKTGGIILASNHASHLDPPMLGVATRQCELHFMARSTLFRPRWFGWLLQQVHAHPIIRGQGPNQDWNVFINLIKAGNALLVFPEGTRTETGELQRGKSGFGRLVHMTQAPVFPAYIQGTYQAWPKGGKYRPGNPVKVIFGHAVPLADLLSAPGEKRIIRQISDRVMQSIAALKEEIECIKK